MISEAHYASLCYILAKTPPLVEMFLATYRCEISLEWNGVSQANQSFPLMGNNTLLWDVGTRGD